MESQWALANFTVPPECACVCAFGTSSTVYGNFLFFFVTRLEFFLHSAELFIHICTRRYMLIETITSFQLTVIHEM